MKEKILKFLEETDDILQIGISLVLLITSAVVLISSTYQFVGEVQHNMINAIFHLLHKLLLIMILLELMSTVLTYLKEHTIPLEPFIVIGIISGLRKLLMAGAHISIMEGEEINAALFHQYLMDLGVNALVVFLLIISLFIIHKYKTSGNPA